MTPVETSENVLRRRKILAAARLAISGSALLSGVVSGCGTGKTEEKIVEKPVDKIVEKVVEKERVVEVPETKPTVTKKTENIEGMTLAKFTADCAEKAGIVQLHASCAGSNSCKGLSFSYGTLLEHTCRGLNTCAGMSCVVLPQDANLTGAEILEGKRGETKVGSETQCSFCHGEGKTEFSLPIDPSADAAAAKSAFEGKSKAALITAVAFGIHGQKSDGTAFANMPGFYKFYSRAEIVRVVDHIKTLPVTVKKWEDPK
jgi:mono/diheme cytochrome c family protein